MTDRLPESFPLPNPNESILTIPQEPHKPSTATIVINRFLALALVAATAALVVMLYWSVATTTPLVIENSPFPARVVTDPTGTTGGTVYLTARYCKDTDAEGEVRISYLSKSREQFTPLITERIKKGCGTMVFPVVIPKNLSQDEYRMRFHVLYDLNPIRQNISVDFESQAINIGSVN